MLMPVSIMAGSCKNYVVDFILLKGDPLMASIEDDVRSDLAKVGITVNTRLLEKNDFNTAMAAGDFNLCFTETWGPPYDPHSFASGWARPNNEAHYQALSNLEPPMTKDKLLQMITDVVSVESEQDRLTKWSNILSAVHEQAVDLPMWSRRMPAILNRRLTGYQSGQQQWDYPMQPIQVLSGSLNITVAPGGRTGIFVATGDMDPHSYSPNEFFIQNWLYEGLVSYGPEGAILPQLATSWTVTNTQSGGQQYTFKLRSGVTFHDGTTFDCSAVKLNFDHVLQPAMTSTTKDYHGWYQLPAQVVSWTCMAPDTFVVTLKTKYYPFLQELSLIRPLRMLSPAMFQNGLATNPATQNSCPKRFGTLTSGSSTVTCAGIKGVSGTGPWIYNGTLKRADGSVAEVQFLRNTAHWAPGGNVQMLRVLRYDSPDQIKADLLSGALDMVVGGGALKPSDVKEFMTQRMDNFQTLMGPLLMNTVVVLNTAKVPTNDIQVRRVIMAAVNKAAIVDKELAGLATPADSLYPKDAPYCDVDLTPRWDYDFQKASLLNCPDTPPGPNVGLIVGLVLGLGVPIILGLGIGLLICGKRIGYRQGLYDKLNERSQKSEAREVEALEVPVGAQL